METNDKKRTITIAVVTGVIALLFGLCLGALVGGAGGFLLGRQMNAQPVGEYNSEEADGPRLVIPDAAATPQTPIMPNLRNQNGALVREVVAGTPAADAGLRMGDIITAVDDLPLDRNHRLVDVIAGYKPGDRVTLKVQRGMQTRTVEVTLGENPEDRTRPFLGIYYLDLPLEQPDTNPGS